jgi:hypothetical protein
VIIDFPGGKVGEPSEIDEEDIVSLLEYDQIPSPSSASE